MKNILITAGAVAAVLALSATGTAVAGDLIGAKQIKTDAIHARHLDTGSVGSDSIKDWSVQARDLSPYILGKISKNTVDIEVLQRKVDGLTPGTPGAKGDTGPAGTDGLLDAYYATAYYNAGDTNPGAIATVACKNTTDVALSGGVQVLGLDAGANSRNTPVSSSFPGRMDWSTNTPRPGRLDGWIVQFGGNAGPTSDKAPEKTVVFALCAPGASVPVVETFRQQ